MAKVANTTHPLWPKVKALIVIDGGVIKDLKEPSRTFTPTPDGVAFGTGAYGEHFELLPASFYSPNTVAMSPVISENTFTTNVSWFMAVNSIAEGQAAGANNMIGAYSIPSLGVAGGGGGKPFYEDPSNLTTIVTGNGAHTVARVRHAGDPGAVHQFYVDAALETTGNAQSAHATAASLGHFGGEAGTSTSSYTLNVFAFFGDHILTAQEVSDLDASLTGNDAFALVTIEADTAAPDITSTGTGSTNGPFAFNCAEKSTGVCATFTSSEPLSTVVKGGADAALFTLGGSGTTRTLTPTSAFNFESLPHANPFVVTLAFSDEASPANTRTVTANITITNVNEPPDPPTIGMATAGSGSASVAFTAPDMTGKPSITGYTATASPGGATGTGISSPIAVSGLTNGTAYTFTVTATNSEGTSSPSAASNSATPASAVPPGVFTSEPLVRNNEGTLAANVALDYVRLYNPSNGAMVLERTGLSTNGGGVFTLTDAALVAGTIYLPDWKEAGGQRRMPPKAAT